MRTSDFLARFLPRQGRGDLLVVAATVIWSVNVVVLKVALQGSGPLTYSALRYIVGGIALLLLARYLEGPVHLPPRGDRRLLVALATCGVLVNQSSFSGSLALTNADNVAMISATTPVLVAIWLVWRSHERFRSLVWVGLGLGLLGLGLVVGAGHWSGLLGIGIALLNPLSWQRGHAQHDTTPAAVGKRWGHAPSRGSIGGLGCIRGSERDALGLR